MNVAFIVENLGAQKFNVTRGLDYGSSLCVYNVESHEISWHTLDENKAANGNIAVRLFDEGIDSVVATRLDDFLIQELNQNEIRVYQAWGNDLIDNIKRFNKNYLREMEGEKLLVAAQLLRQPIYAEAF